MFKAYQYYTGSGRPVDLARALELYQQAAAMGDAEAMFIAGGMLYRGQGADPDPVRAFRYLQEAEKRGRYSPESLSIIGTLYLQGAGVPQNYRLAKSYLTRAAEMGDITAKKNLAYLLYNGLGGGKDYGQALRLYRQAALSGDNEAQYNVGLMYANGLGSGVDRVRAYAWFSLAASRGNTAAAAARNGLLARMSWEELNKAQELAVDLFNQVEENKSQAGPAWRLGPDRP